MLIKELEAAELHYEENNKGYYIKLLSKVDELDYIWLLDMVEDAKKAKEEYENKGE